jgi:N-formylglutamate amidohydrolase
LSAIHRACLPDAALGDYLCGKSLTISSSPQKKLPPRHGPASDIGGSDEVTSAQEGLFSVIGPRHPASPVVIAVPHAGRDYPPALRAIARVGVERLAALEDRFADMLCSDAARDGAAIVVANRARAWIDLNRDPREIDPAMISPPPDPAWLVQSAKLRAGLGLLPRRLGSIGELWTRRLSPDDVAERLSDLHEPYHAAIADRLRRARAAFGHALLIDCHSMPPLGADRGRAPAQIVLGDRFGASADPGLTDLAGRIVIASGLRVARNAPYAGGYTLDRHGAPRRGIHALQVEYDRGLYLAGSPGEIHDGIDRCRALLADLAAALAGALVGRSADDSGLPIAAE